MDGLTDDQIATTVVQGGAAKGYPNMPSHPHIKGQDLVALVAHVRTLSRGVNGVSEVTTPAELARRAHALLPRFSPKYRQASWLETAFFDQVMVRLRPPFRYPSQINANLAAGNPFAITPEDRERCAQLVRPLPLVTAEDWFREYFQLTPPAAGA